MRVGFIGLGTMGRHMAANLQRAGHDMAVHDIRPEAAEPFLERGAAWSDSPAGVATGSEVVFTSLPGPAEVEVIALGEGGLLGSMAPGSAWFELSTSSPALARALHPRFAERGVDFLDAPVSGGPRGAETGRLAIWVGGDEAVFQRFRPVLEAFGDQPFYVGPVGAGLVAKLVHNCAGYTVQAALAEVFTLGAKAGVEPGALFEAVRQGASGRARTFDRLADQFLPGRYHDPPAFALRLAHKDMTLATELAREMRVPMRLSDLALDELTEALNRGWGDRDSRAAMLLQQERAGVGMGVDPERLRRILEQ